MKHRITAVDMDSIAEELGVEPGWSLVSVDGEAVLDVIDYEQLTTKETLELCFETSDGESVYADVEKELYEPLGLNCESGLMSPIKSCKNHCVFCFIDQMPKGVRSTLHVKDDDWRLSLIMGNYVTLTNIDDTEFMRILKRRVSPLYISVHATDGEVRKTMMRNPTAVRLMERLSRLKREGMQFHAQIVLCPGLNDGEILTNTLSDLFSLAPAAQSVAVVPVGLTKHRNGLTPLRTLTREEAREAISRVEACNARALQETGQGFAYASDEMYCIAGLPLPPYEEYQEFPQIENGVGLLRKFEAEFKEALAEKAPLESPVTVDAATGASAFPFLQPLFALLAPYGIRIVLHRIENDYFGHSVTVSGLMTAGDLAAQLKGKLASGMLLLPDDTLREREDVFLDGEHLEGLQNRLSVRIVPLCASDGTLFIEELFDTLKNWK